MHFLGHEMQFALLKFVGFSVIILLADYIKKGGR